MGVLSSGRSGAAVAGELQRLLPHEDVVLLIDQAYAPYARRPQRVVADRVRRLAAGLVETGAKAVVLASRTATLDVAAEPLRVSVPVIGLEAALDHAVRRPGTARVAVIAGSCCLRAPSLAADLRRARGRRDVTADLWPELVDLVETRAGSDAAPGGLVERRVAALLAAGTGVVALGCIHAAAVGPALRAAARDRLEVVDPALLTAARARNVLAQDGLLVRRRRAGWCRLVSSHPTAAAAWPSRRRRGASAPSPLAPEDDEG